MLTNHPSPTASDKQGTWEEDLSWLAIRGVELGRALCTCSAFYHELRGPLRASGVFRGRRGEAILASTISPLINNQTRILIAGSADTGVFSAVRRISDQRTPDVTVVDRCRAPLALIEEFAAMKGAVCGTLHSDIIDLDGNKSWDLILLHYTSMYFDRLNRKRYFERLSSCLAPGGLLVCMDKILESPADRGEEERELAWFLAARKILKDSSYGSFWESAELDNMLRQHAHERVVRNADCPTVGEIENVLMSVGLKIRAKDNDDLNTESIMRPALEYEPRSVSIVVAERDN